jgi:hypothetical protein
MEDFYYTGTTQHARKITLLKKLKAKLVCLNNKHHKKMILDIGDQDRMTGENPSLHHIIGARKRQHRRMIQQIRDEQEATHTTTTTIIQAFATHFCKKFQPIHIDEDNTRQLLNCEFKEVANEVNMNLDQPVSMTELWTAPGKGKPHKAPGPDGIGTEFYKRT